MKRLRLTRFEHSWMRILGLLFFVLVGIFLVKPILSHVSKGNEEPLADQAILSLLIQGIPIPAPSTNEPAQFHGTKVTPPTIASLSAPTQVLGVSSADKHIEVDLTNQRVYAFEGDRKIYDFPVSTGKWAPTPTGEFKIWTKLKSTLMHGGNPNDGTYYYLPNVPWVMFFYNNENSQARGFSLHGTYWHNNFGHPMSHGCVNMRTEDAKVIFEWATPVITDAKAWSTNATAENPGTRVIIYGTTPRE